MTNVAIVYYSATGNIHKLAVAAARKGEHRLYSTLDYEHRLYPTLD